jgi:hypothetical protein
MTDDAMTDGSVTGSAALINTASGGRVASGHPAEAEQRARHDATLARGAQGWHPPGAPGGPPAKTQAKAPAQTPAQPAAQSDADDGGDPATAARDPLAVYALSPQHAGLARGDDPVLRSARQAARDAGISPAQFRALADSTLGAAVLARGGKPATNGALSDAEREAAHARADAAFAQAQRAALGAEGPRLLATLSAAGERLQSAGVLSKAELGTYRAMITTAAQARLMAKLLKLEGGS